MRGTRSWRTPTSLLPLPHRTETGTSTTGEMLPASSWICSSRKKQEQSKRGAAGREHHHLLSCCGTQRGALKGVSCLIHEDQGAVPLIASLHPQQHWAVPAGVQRQPRGWQDPPRAAGSMRDPSVPAARGWEAHPFPLRCKPTWDEHHGN